MTVTKTEEVYADVKNYYGYRAENEVNLALRLRIAIALGYDPISTATVPHAANIGEGCGNPLIIANLAEVGLFALSNSPALFRFPSSLPSYHGGL